MRLADYIISYSLQINNRCLRFLADSHARGSVVAPEGGTVEGEAVQLEVQPVYAESMLVRDSRRLASMWAWVDAQQHGIVAHRERLALRVEELTAKAAPTRLALRLASQAVDDDDATHLLRLARGLEAESGVTWTTLNDLFTEDSALWRQGEFFGELDDEVLLQRLCTSYRKGYKLNKKLPRQWPRDMPDRKIGKILSKQNYICQFNLHQLELLRPGLSEKGKRQLWYLDKLADAHRMVSGLEQLRSMIPAAELRKPVAKATQSYVRGQIEKIYKRIERLSPRAYDPRPKRFRHGVQHSLLALGLQTVHALVASGGEEAEIAQHIAEERRT